MSDGVNLSGGYLSHFISYMLQIMVSNDTKALHRADSMIAQLAKNARADFFFARCTNSTNHSGSLIGMI